MSYKSPNIIAAEDLVDCTRWLLPDMDGDGKVLPSAEKEQKDKAAREAEIIEEVEGEEELTFSPITAEELQAITDQAEKEGFEQGKTAGFEKGLNEGREQGLQQGLEQAERQAAEILEQQVSQLLLVAEALVNPIEGQQRQIESILLNYVTSLTRQVIERELIQDSSHILSVVKRAIAALPVGAEQIILTLNPDDLALVEAYSEEQSLGWRFRGDSDLLPGGCRIETDESLVDFSVESKLDAMFTQFLDRQLVDPESDATLPEDIEVESATSSDEMHDDIDQAGLSESMSLSEDVPLSETTSSTGNGPASKDISTPSDSSLNFSEPEQNEDETNTRVADSENQETDSPEQDS